MFSLPPHTDHTSSYGPRSAPMKLFYSLFFICSVTAQVPTLDALAASWLPANESINNMPTVTNFWGASTISADPLDALGIDTFDAFPFVGWLKTRLSALDPSGAARTFAPNASRWLPHKTQRTAAAPGSYFAPISAAITHRFLFESTSTLISLTLRNDGAAPVTLRSLQLLLTAGVRTTTEMSWVVPRPSDDGSWACGVLPSADATRTPVLRFLDGISRARAVVATFPSPVNFTSFGYAFGSSPGATCGGNASFGDVTLLAGASWSLDLALIPGMDDSLSNATSALLALLANPAAAASGSDAAWETRWAQAFVPGNAHYSGNAPVLEGASSAAAARYYYSSILTVVTTQRVGWSSSPLFTDCPRVYVIGQEGLAGGGAPAGRPLGGSAFWLWDEAYASLTLSLLDPAAVRAYLRAIYKGVDWTTTNAFDLLSGRPILPWPNGFGGGSVYAFNPLQLFTATSQYVTATNDAAFLGERLGPLQRRVVDTLLELSLHWRGFAAGGGFLAEYSDTDDNYLECVPHYRGAVAALQGGSVFMMRSFADAVERLFPSDPALQAWPQQLRALAKNMTAATMGELYLPGMGFWSAFVTSASPQAAPVPTVVDFAHVARFFRPDLSPTQRNESNAFFFADLLFPTWTGWLRALAAPDGGAGSQRADHGTTGAYTTWAALSIEAVAFNDGGWARAVELFSRFAPALRLGPLGQAGQVQIIGSKGGNATLHPVFKAPQWPFVNIAGANFADVIIRSLFGFSPRWGAGGVEDLALAPALGQGGFLARLLHLRTPLGKLAGVESDGAALKWALEEA